MRCFKDEGAVVVRSQQKENRSLAEARDRDLSELGLHQEWSKMNCLRMWLMGLSPMFLMNGLIVQESFADRYLLPERCGDRGADTIAHERRSADRRTKCGDQKLKLRPSFIIKFGNAKNELFLRCQMGRYCWL